MGYTKTSSKSHVDTWAITCQPCCSCKMVAGVRSSGFCLKFLYELVVKYLKIKFKIKTLILACL